MHSYDLYGGCLASAIPFPGLRRATGVLHDWCLSVRKSAIVPCSGELLGAGLEPHCAVRLFRADAGYVLEHSCTGQFEISTDGRSITWIPASDAPVEAGQADVIGRVLAVALHATGHLPLHASGVLGPDGVIAFIAPKGTGKSTLACAMMHAGATLVTDDMLVVRPDHPVHALPGHTSIRLREDSARLLAGTGRTGSRTLDGKRVFHETKGASALQRALPLAAIYLLEPAATDMPEAARRVAISPREAAMTLVAHAKAGALLRGSEAPVVLGRAIDLACSVPVLRVHVTRDLGRIGDVARTILEWHGGAQPARAYA